MISLAHAAETLTAVAAPTDWTGIAIVISIVFIIFGVFAYVQYIKRPGLQRGEEAFEKMHDLLGKAHDTIVALAAANKAHAEAKPIPGVLLTAEPAPPAVAAQPAPAKFPADWSQP